MTELSDAGSLIGALGEALPKPVYLALKRVVESMLAPRNEAEAASIVLHEAAHVYGLQEVRDPEFVLQELRPHRLQCHYLPEHVMEDAKNSLACQKRGREVDEPKTWYLTSLMPSCSIYNIVLDIQEF